MNTHKPLLLIGSLVTATLCYGQTSEITPENRPEITTDDSHPVNTDVWVPFEGAEKVASGIIIEWKAPVAGTVYFAEATREICFLTKSVSAGDVFETIKDGDFDELLGEAIDLLIPDAEEDDVFPTLRFHLFFRPEQAQGETPMKPFTFSLTPDGIRIEGEDATPEQLQSALEEIPKESPIRIRVDSSMPHQEVVTMMDLCQQSGFSNVALSTFDSGTNTDTN